MTTDNKSLIDKVLESRKADIVVKVSVSGAIIRLTVSSACYGLPSVDSFISNFFQGLEDEFKIESAGKNSSDIYVSSNYDVAEVGEIIASACEEQQLSVTRILEGSGIVNSFVGKITEA